MIIGKVLNVPLGNRRRTAPGRGNRTKSTRTNSTSFSRTSRKRIRRRGNYCVSRFTVSPPSGVPNAANTCESILLLRNDAGAVGEHEIGSLRMAAAKTERIVGRPIDRMSWDPATDRGTDRKSYSSAKATWPHQADVNGRLVGPPRLNQAFAQQQRLRRAVGDLRDANRRHGAKNSFRAAVISRGELVGRIAARHATDRVGTNFRWTAKRRNRRGDQGQIAAKSRSRLQS